jgi:peptidoglycan/xylan/chitin deacetylase (PgdA/CDA1 family)
MSLAGGIIRGVGARLPSFMLRPLTGPSAVFFHGVELKVVDPHLQSNHQSIEDFYALAVALKSDFDVAPLEALPDVLAAPMRHRRTVFLMSDDGYANTLTVAAPVLQALKLPWTLFVSTEHIDTGERNPFFLARLFFRYAPDGSYMVHGLETAVVLGAERRLTERRVLSALRALPLTDAKRAVHEMVSILERHGLTHLLSEYHSDAFLDWEGVRALSRQGVTIGAHAHWHWPMHREETAETLRMQAELPRERIKAEVGHCRHFAYPFGNTRDVSKAAWQAVRDAGYDYGFTTLSGTLDASHNPWLLPRYGLRMSEPRLANSLRLLRLGNRRVARWQRSYEAT